jgi:hypothetical protein
VAKYNRRDLIGHYVKQASPEQKMCQHACCRGRRVHPENYPVILPSKLLRSASDDDLARGYALGTERRQAQILHEMERRDREQITKAQKAKDRKARQHAREFAHAEEIDRVWLEAEAATNGNMLNKKGRAAGISDRWLMTASEPDVRRYGSEELHNYFAEHHRPTAAAMRGKDTRLGVVYTAPKRKQYGVSLHRPAPARPGRDWSAMRPGDFTTSNKGTQGGLVPVDSQGRVGGNMF